MFLYTRIGLRLLQVRSSSTGKVYNLRYKLGGSNVEHLHADYEGCRLEKSECDNRGFCAYVPNPRKRRERSTSRANREAEGMGCGVRLPLSRCLSV